MSSMSSTKTLFTTSYPATASPSANRNAAVGGLVDPQRLRIGNCASRAPVRSHEPRRACFSKKALSGHDLKKSNPIGFVRPTATRRCVSVRSSSKPSSSKRDSESPVYEQDLKLVSQKAQRKHELKANAALDKLRDWLPPIAATPLAAGLMGTGLDLSGPTSVASAIACLAAIIAVHESGHFMAARLQNIYVTKFSIGFGPTVFKYQGDVVEYTLRAFPLGGFVAFPEDDPDSEYDPDDKNLLRNRPIKDRAIVISAGVIANVIFAYSILLTQMTTLGEAVQNYSPGAIVPEILEVSAARRDGIEVGDIIMSIDGVPVKASEGSVTETVKFIRQHPDEKLNFHIIRGGEEIDLPVTPIKGSKGQGLIGCQLASNVEVSYRKATNPIEAAEAASRSFGKLSGQVVDGLKQIIFNFSQVSNQVAGPVAIVAVGAEAAKTDATGIFQFAAIVNINLALFNVLPIPALDGGYLALLAVEALRGGKKIPTMVEQGIMGSGFVIMLGLGLILIVRDTFNLVH